MNWLFIKVMVSTATVTIMTACFLSWAVIIQSHPSYQCNQRVRNALKNDLEKGKTFFFSSYPPSSQMKVIKCHMLSGVDFDDGGNQSPRRKPSNQLKSTETRATYNDCKAGRLIVFSQMVIHPAVNLIQETGSRVSNWCRPSSLYFWLWFREMASSRHTLNWSQAQQ